MKLLRLLTLALVLAAAGLPALSARAAEPNVLNFGIISTESSQNLRTLWEPFLKRMEQETGFKVRAFFAPDYAGIVTGMQYGKVQLAWYGNKSAIEAVDRADGEIFAQTMDQAGIGGYYSHLIVNKDSPYNSVDDILKNAKNITFSNGDPNSTSGFVIPGYYVFAKNNIEPKTAFKRTLNANHETNALAVANKQVDLATNNSESLERLRTTHPEKAGLIKIIWTSPLIPGDPLVWRKDLPKETKDKIAKFFFNFGVSGPHKAADLKILANLGLAPFKPANNDHSIPIRQVELFKTRVKIEGDGRLSAAEKKAQLAKVDEALATLNARAEAIKKGS